jgi:ornithine cyclodeaminase/alanine dehydrogenase-like protein (mu-crystallin family)
VKEKLPFVTADELERLLPMKAAIDALEATFGAVTSPSAPPRSRIETGTGDLLLMPAVGDAGAGVKLVTVNPNNPGRGLPLIHALYVLFHAETLEPLAMFEGGALTGLRTAAVSGLATRWLARPEGGTLVMFGAGVQAATHLDAMKCERPLEQVWVVSRTEDRARSLVAAAREAGLEADVALPGAVAQADLVCTCTTSARPVFDGTKLKPGAHLNAVGSYRPETRELDTETIRRGRLVVETRGAALAEAGDLLIPISEGAISEDDVVADLSEVVHGSPVRTAVEDITVFKSVGVAFEDLAVAGAAYERMNVDP